MFKAINNFLRGVRSWVGTNQSKLNSKSGQVAIVIILLIALSLFVYAVALNLGRVSQFKTITMSAADSGVGTLASRLASYGQNLFAQQLGGKRRVCKSTGVFGIIIGIIIAIVAIVIIVISSGTATALAIAIVALVLNIIALVIQLVIIQPGITDMWNKLSSASLDITDQFLEAGLRAGLQSSVTDRVLVPDLHDLDSDGLFVEDPLAADPLDKVSRFAVFYDHILRTLETRDFSFVEEFLEAADELTFQGTDDFGLFDPMDRDDPASPCFHDPFDLSPPLVPSQCNPCCTPEQVLDTSGVIDEDTGQIARVYVRPGCCDTGDEDECGVSFSCGEKSPYGPDWPFVYDEFFEDFTNNDCEANPATCFVSFREFIGHDDEHILFHANPIEPFNYPPTQIDNELEISQVFQREDATGYYARPFHYANRHLPPDNVEVNDAAVPDPRPGVHQFFWELAFGGLNLNSIDHTGTPQHCYLCDPEHGNQTVACEDCDIQNEELPIAIEPPAYLTGKHVPQLDLPIKDPALLVYNVSNFVEGTNDNNHGDPPLAPDKVFLSPGIIAGDAVCAEDVLLLATPSGVVGPAGQANASPDDGFWKPGADRYCTDLTAVDPTDPGDGWPYWTGCPKHRPGGVGCEFTDSFGSTFEGENDCNCGEGGTDPTLFPEDGLDFLYYMGIPRWVEVVTLIRNLPPNRFVEWYHIISDWIEPQGDGFSPFSTGPFCFTCNDDPGHLFTFLFTLREAADRVEDWRDNVHVGADIYRGGACNEVWCVPPLGCPEFPQGEQDFLTSIPSDYPYGALDTVVGCLNYNAEGLRYNEEVPILNEGNDYRFQLCIDACTGIAPNGDLSADHIALANRYCKPEPLPDEPEYLPRTLIPPGDWPRADFEPFTDAEIETFRELFDCPATCSECENNCALGCNTGGTIVCDPDTGVCTQTGGGADQACIDACVAGCACPASGCECADIKVRGTCFEEEIEGLKKTCAVLNPWHEGLVQSQLEAQNQVEKLRHRRDFLQERMEEADAIIEEFRRAADEVEEFLLGPAQDFILQRIFYDENFDSNLSFHTVYGWQAEVEDDNIDQGLWHVVRVDGRLPRKCDERCNREQTGEQDEFPRVKTKTKSFGLERCFELVDTDGTVKFRVARFDEDPEGTNMVFPSGQQIWQNSFVHPLRRGVSGGDPEILEDICDASGGDIGPDDPDGILEGAFIMNEREDHPACWDAAHDFLQQGTVSEVCARYYFHTGLKKGMGFQFVECLEF